MGTTDHGIQDVSYNYYEEATAEDFNKRHLENIPRGIYQGGHLKKVTNSEITLSPFVVEIGDDDEQISAKSSQNATLNSGTLDSGGISSATPYIVLRWGFVEQSNNYVEVHALANVAAAQANDIIVGKCDFSEGPLSEVFDYTDRILLNVQGILLRVEPTEDTEMRVWVRGGRVHTASQCVVIPEQKVGLFAVPGAPNSRIDLVYIDTDGTVKIKQGVQGTNPSIPDYGGKLVIAEVTIVNGDTNIVASGITDVRSFISNPIVSSIFGSRTDKDSLNNTLVKNGVYRAGSDGSISAYVSGAGSLIGYTDGNNPPIAIEAQDINNQWNEGAFISMLIRKNDYWKVTASQGTPTIHWLPIGSGTCVKQ